MASVKRNGGPGKSILMIALFGLGLPASASATSRSATTTVAVRVERHVGVLLPTSSNGLTYASLGGSLPPSGPTAFGNGSSRIIVSHSSDAAFRPVARQSSPARVEVTVFEP